MSLGTANGSELNPDVISAVVLLQTDLQTPAHGSDGSWNQRRVACLLRRVNQTQLRLGCSNWTQRVTSAQCVCTVLYY